MVVVSELEKEFITGNGICKLLTPLIFFGLDTFQNCSGKKTKHSRMLIVGIHVSSFKVLSKLLVLSENDNGLG